MDTPRPSPRTNRTRRVPHPVLIGHAAQQGTHEELIADEGGLYAGLWRAQERAQEPGARAVLRRGSSSELSSLSLPRAPSGGVAPLRGGGGSEAGLVAEPAGDDGATPPPSLPY